MARPKKPRMVDGVQLADNLYPDNKGRVGFYRYLRPDNTFKHFPAETVFQANQYAELANQKRSEYGGPKPAAEHSTMLAKYVEEYINYREHQSPGLKTKKSWRNRCYQLRKFSREQTKPFTKLFPRDISDWWEFLTYFQQKARHAEFRKFFNYLMARKVLPNFEYNPFTTADDKPRLYTREQPNRSRERLSKEGFWFIYNAAGKLGYEGLQVAMGMSLTTFMREEDILTTRIDAHVVGNVLQRTIHKSIEQKGYQMAARRKWNTDTHELLRQVIKKGRALSLKNSRCPFLVSHKPLQKRRGKTKEHICQVTPKRLQEMFNEARDLTKHWKELPKGKKPPTFHECRALADKLASEAGYTIDEIQHAMAHSDKSQTLLYLANQDLPFEPVDVIFNEGIIGGNFR